MFQSRTHTCNELRLANVGETVTIVGWYENLRKVSKNLGFLVLRDFYGVTQVVVETEYDKVNTNIANLDCFDSLRDERSDNNMVVVDHGKTILKVKESTKVAGILISLLGISLLLVFWKKIIFDNRA